MGRKKRFGVSLVIPNYNSLKLLEGNLEYVIEAAYYPGNSIKEVIVVDDGSYDSSVSFIRKRFPEVKLIRHKVNRGFSAAVNTGVRSAKGDLIALLATDVIPKRNFLEDILPLFKDNKVFGVTLHGEGQSWVRGSFEDGFIVHQPGIPDKNFHDTFWVSGEGGLFRKDFWLKLGGMDEKLFGFLGGGADLNYRALKSGMKLYWTPQPGLVYKHESIAARLGQKKAERFQEGEKLILIWKNLTSQLLFRKHLLGLFRRLYQHPGYIKILIKALARLGLIIKARRKEKKEGKVSDEAVFARFNY